MKPSTNNFRNLTKEQKIKIIKAFLVILCLFGFFCNSYLIVLDFIDGNTVISTDLEHPKNEGLMSPSILICGQKSFKTTKLNTNLSDYIENSLKLEEFLEFVMFIPGGDGILESKTKDISDQFRSFYTVYFGTCYMMDAKVMVSVKTVNVELCLIFFYFKISKCSLFPLPHI